MRKIIIGLVSLAVVALAFWAYVQVMDTTLPLMPQKTNVDELPMPQTNTGAGQQAGQTEILDANQPRYVVIDPVTKEPRRVLGFEKLLNPGQESSRWRVEKPYLVFYESSYSCRVDSDAGTFQIETSGANATPKDIRDAQLDGNVVIHVIPKSGRGISEIFIYMDDLTFSSERSEFATDGPVKVVSEQLQLDGFGLILIFDTANGRVDYMHIRDLEKLRLFNMVASESPTNTPAIKEPVQSVGRKNVSPQVPQSQTVSQTDAATDSQKAVSATPSDYYQCILDNNVVIYYGDKLRVVGADQIAIQNILFSKINPAGEEEEPFSKNQKKDITEPMRPRSGAVPSTKNPSLPMKSDNSRDVIILCDGGIILKPMQAIEVTPQTDHQELSVEMRGADLRIEQPSTDAEQQNTTLVRCGILKYEPAEDILRLFTDMYQPEIVLNAQTSQGRIETRGNVLWNRKTQQANIAGPGRVFLVNDNSANEPSEVTFKGQMELLFAQPTREYSAATLQTINLTGGMDAVLKRDVWYKTIADSATIEFGPDNSLTSAYLQGDVRFESMQADKPQRAVADSAKLEFGINNSLTAAHMRGDVRFESYQDSNESHAAADTATFYFEQDKVRTADLKGAVSIASQSGRLTSSDVTIEFEPDASGSIHPAKVYTSADAILQTVPDTSHEPAVFEARKIDYDLKTGSGLAHGPVRFTFYQSADPNMGIIDPWIPITVTADKNAEFIADATGSISQVVFNQNVLSVRRVETAESVQLDSFHGDKLIVYPGKGQTDSLDIRQISITEGKVFAETIRMRGDIKLFHAKLDCKEITWDRMGNTLLATGPGKIEIVSNEESSLPASEQTGMDLRRPCVAQLVGFDTILWSLQEQEITADGKQETMQLVYVPLIEDKPEKYIYVNSMQFHLSFAEDSSNRAILEKVFTDKGIIYRENNADQSKTLHELIGQTLNYDALSSDGWLTVSGTDANPCSVDGIRVPVIHYNLNTGELKTSLSTIPGVLSSTNPDL